MTSRHIPWRPHDDRPRGPSVNVSFTLDGESVDLLWKSGKNRSRTVRNAIKYYLQDIEPTPELQKKFNQVCIERQELLEVVEIQRKTIARLKSTHEKQGGNVFSRLKRWLFAPKA